MKTKYFLLKSHRLPWLLIYVFSNIIAALIIFRDGYLLGDVAFIKLFSFEALFVSLVLVLISYYIIAIPLFNFIKAFRVNPIRFGAREEVVGSRIGKALLILQILYFVYNITAGVNVAGSRLSGHSSSPFSIIWVLIPVDMIFIIYYAFYRENKYFKVNALVWVVSQLSRGWVGGLMTVAFFEWCRLVQSKSLTTTKVLMIMILLVLMYPFVSEFKWIVRANSESGISYDLVAVAILNLIMSNDFTAILAGGFEHFVARIHFVSITVELIKLSDVLQDAFNSGRLMPFWMEGLHGLVFDKLINGDKRPLASVAFTEYEYFPGKIFEVGSYNISLGFLSWFYIAPYWIPLYLVYAFLLAFISYYLVSKVGKSQLSEDMLWYYWLTLLLAGWLFVFVTFIHSLILFIFLKYIFSRNLSKLLN